MISIEKQAREDEMENFYIYECPGGSRDRLLSVTRECIVVGGGDMLAGGEIIIRR